MTGVPSGSAPTATALTAPSWPRSGSPTGVPSASRHTRTVPSPPPLTMTGVPSGSAPAATALTEPLWPVSGSPTGVPSASRHTRTVPSAPPLMMTGVPSGSAPTATARHPAVVAGEDLVAGGRRPWDQRVCQGRSGAALAMRAARLRQPSWWAVSSSWLARAGGSRGARRWALCRYTAAAARAGADRAASRWGTSRAGSTVSR